MDEQDLIDGLLAATPSAADALIDRFAQPLIRYFSVHLSDRSQAEDMTQEVFCRLISYLRRQASQGQIRSLYSLVFTIARNLVRDVRKAGNRKFVFESLAPFVEAAESPPGPVMVQLPSFIPSPRDEAIAAEENRHLEAALRRLPTDLREVLILHHVQGMSGREIAQILGIAEGTVWSRVSRGLETLKLLMTSPDSAIPKRKPKKGTAE